MQSSLTRSLIRSAILSAAVLSVGTLSIGCSEDNMQSPVAAKPQAPAIQMRSFGETYDGEKVEQIKLTNGNGASVCLMTYGATVTNLEVPDKDGHLGDVVLGLDTIKEYQRKSPYFGAVVGRVGNRIAKGEFKVEDRSYAVPVNNGPNMLHGGFKGYDKRIWNAEPIMTADGPSVRFTLTDADGTEGFPGTVKISVIYSLTSGKGDDGAYNGLKNQHFATTDQPTPINLTNHTYWNLKDGGKSTIENHWMKVFGDHYTPVDATLIPTGELAPVAGTPIDFTKPKPIGKDLKAMGGDPVGYDHNLVLNNQDGSFAKAIQIYEPDSGRLMDLYTTEPGCQFYSGNFLDGSVTGKDDVAYQQHTAIVLETQHYPDSINHKNFPSALLKPGEVYRQVTEYRFGVMNKAPW